MSTDSSAKNAPSEDRFAPYNEIEDSLQREIACCPDLDIKEQLTWKLAIFYLETARPEKAIVPIKWIAETTRKEESRQDALRALQFLYGSNEIPASGDNLNLPRVLWVMGNAYLAKGSQQQGVICLLRLLEISSDHEQRAECFLLLGIECEKVDDYERAVRLYQQGIECGPKEIRTRYFLHNNLGYCLNQFGWHPEAESMCRIAIEIDPRLYNAYKNLGLALKGQGEIVEASKLFLRAATMFPPDPRSLNLLEELIKAHRDEVEAEIPNIDDLIAAAFKFRENVIQ